MKPTARSSLLEVEVEVEVEAGSRGAGYVGR